MGFTWIFGHHERERSPKATRTAARTGFPPQRVPEIPPSTGITAALT